MAQPNYIEIGQVCQAFQETAPPNILSVYVVGVAINSIIKHNGTIADDTTSYRTISLISSDRSSSAQVNYADYTFNILFDQNLVRDGTNTLRSRRLVPGTVTELPGGSMSTNSIITSSAGWPINTFTSRRSNYLGNTVEVKKTTDGTFESLIENSIPLPGDISSKTQEFYLRDVSTKKIYLYSSGSSFTPIDTSGLLFQPVKGTNYTAFFVTYVTVGNPATGKRLGISISSGGTGAEIAVTSITYDTTSFSYIFVINGTSYEATTTAPVESAALVLKGLPTEITMIKSITNGKYLAWNGLTGAPVLSLMNYWGDNLTIGDIRQKFQFYFQDLTRDLDAGSSPTGGSVDFYRWNVLSSTAQGAPTSNLYVASPSTLTYGAIPGDSMREGWVFNATGGVVTSPPTYHLVYVKDDGTGSLAPVAYANIVQNSDTISIQQYTGQIQNLPSNSRSWQCIKCTPSSDGTCSVSPAPGTI